MAFAWLKGHGTRNDFVLLPDPDGTVHGALDAAFVARLCDRRSGLGADGVLRVVRTAATGDPAAGEQADAAEWFMDYRNADGSVSEMCGNGIRVFARYLVDAGLVDGAEPFGVATRDGVKTLRVDGDLIAVTMGLPVIGDISKISAAGRAWEAQDIRTGNPHAVVFVDDLDEAGPLRVEPEYDASVYPEGVNIEFVRRLGDDHIAMRVHERGSGETESCGTGACAAAVAHGLGVPGGPERRIRVDLPGGTVWVSWGADRGLVLTGPAEIVARGEMEWLA